MRAAVYCRLSKKPESDENIAQQRARGVALVEERGWTLVRRDPDDAFIDDGISAFKEDAHRPAWVALLIEGERLDLPLADEPEVAKPHVRPQPPRSGHAPGAVEAGDLRAGSPGVVKSFSEREVGVREEPAQLHFGERHSVRA